MSGRDRLSVLHIVANRWWTGSAEPVLQLVLGLRARGHRVLLGLAAGDRFEAKAREAGVEPVDGLRLDVKSGLGVVSDARRLRALVTREGLDVVHTHHSHDHWLGWWGHGTAALIRTFHNERAVRPAWPDSALYRRTDAVVAVSCGIEERLRQARVPGVRLHRADGVVDAARFVTDAPGAAKVREEFGVAGAPLVGCVARLAAGRGHEALIEGFRLLSAGRGDARLLLVGKGERRDALEGVARRSAHPRDLRGILQGEGLERAVQMNIGCVNEFHIASLEMPRRVMRGTLGNPIRPRLCRPFFPCCILSEKGRVEDRLNCL